MPNNIPLSAKGVGDTSLFIYISYESTIMKLDK